MDERVDVMTVVLADCDRGLEALFVRGVDMGWNAIFSTGDDLKPCIYHYKILVKLPEKMNHYEWMQWLRKNKERVLKDILEKLEKVIVNDR